MYRVPWKRNWFFALFGSVRDFLVSIIFVRKLPPFLIKILYGIKPEFVFLVHARRSQDIFVGFPFLVPIRKLISKPAMMKITRKLPPIVVGKIITKEKVNGLTIFSPLLPEQLAQSRRETLKQARRAVSFACKISVPFSCIGLGAWWPIVTRRGLALKEFAKKRLSFVTNGHCATTLSIYFNVMKICKLCGINPENLRIAIIGGAGKVGKHLVEAFLGHVDTIGIIDVNKLKISRLMDRIGKPAFGNTKINSYINSENLSLRDVFDKHHLAICVTSNLARAIRSQDLPDNFIIIDDSRPEAISRKVDSENKIVLEGGLFKIKDSIIDHDYGFGIDENVFGCLAEAYLLSCDTHKKLKPTLGDIDMDNFLKMKEFSNEIGLVIGDFKSQDVYVSDEVIIEIMAKRVKYLGSHKCQKKTNKQNL
ncbi:MAG: hypothetical protein ABH872_00300 [Candidatus Omnitrophota bacterium]